MAAGDEPHGVKLRDGSSLTCASCGGQEFRKPKPGGIFDDRNSWGVLVFECAACGVIQFVAGFDKERR